LLFLTCGPAEALGAGGGTKLALKSAKDNQTEEKKISLAVVDPREQ